jgi:hypothetical protein
VNYAALILSIVLLSPLAAVAAKPADGAGDAPILARMGYSGFLAELRAADAVVTLKVLEETPSKEIDPRTGVPASATLRAEVTDVLKGDVTKGEALDVLVTHARFVHVLGADLGHIYFGVMPRRGESATLLLERGRPWRCANILGTLVAPEFNRAYVRASQATGEERALRLAELYCETSFLKLRDKGPGYGFTRTLVEDLKLCYRDLDPASEPFRRRLVARFADDVFRQCAEPTPFTDVEGWDPVVWLAACMDDAGRRRAVAALLKGYEVSAERLRRLPPRRPPTPVPPGLRAGVGAPAPDPHDTEQMLQSFLLSAMKLVIDPAWRSEIPRNDTLGHIVPYLRLIDVNLKPQAVLPAARAFAKAG